MAGRKEFELLFKLQASLGSNFNSSMNNAMNATKQLNGELSKINSLSKKIDGFQKQSAALQANKDKLAKLAEEHDRLQREMSQTEQPSDSLRKKMESNARQIEQTTARIKEQEARLGTLGDELRDAGVDTNNLAGENERLANSYEKVKKHQDKLDSIAQVQQKNAEAISKTKTQLAGTIGVIGAMGAAIYAGPVQKAVAFNNEMANTGTLLDGQIQPRIQELSKDVIKLSNKSGIGTGVLTDGLYQVISAFGDSAESAKQLDIAAKAGKAGRATTTDAINLLSAVTKGYGDTSADAQQKAADLAFMTAKLGQTTFPELASSMGKVVPLASTLTVKQEELFGVMATLTGVTGNTAEVSTQLRGTLQGFLQPTSQMTKAMSKLGYANGKVMLESLGLQGSLNALKKSVNNDEIAFSGLFGSIEAKNAVLALTGEQAENLTNKTKQMYDAAGAAQAAFDIMNNTPEAKIERAKNAISNLGIVLGDTFLPSVTIAADKLSELVIMFSDWAQENPQVLQSVTKVAATIAGLSVAGLTAKLGFLEMKNGVLEVQKIFEIFKGKTAESGVAAITNSEKLSTLGKNVSGYFGGVKNSLGNLGQSIDNVFGGKLGTLFSNIGIGISDKILSPLGSLGSKIAGAVGGVGGKITGVFGKIGGAIAGGPLGKIGNVIINGPIGKIGGVFQSLGGVAGSVLGPAINGLGGAFGGLFGKVMPIIAIISLLATLFLKMNGGDISGFIEPLKNSFEAVKPTLDAVMEQLRGLGENLMPILIDAANQLAPLFFQIAAAILPVLVSLLQAIMPVISAIAETVLPVLISVLTTIMPPLTNLITSILPVIKTLIDLLIPVIMVLAEVFGSVLGSALQSISTIIGGVTTVFQGLINFITGVFTGNWSQAWNGVKSIFRGIFDSLAGIVKAPINAVISIINGAIGGINKVGYDVPDWVPFIGGKKFKIDVPKIPMLAKGSNYTPDTFIAGEKGAELVTNARGRKVFTAAQTGRIFNNINAAKSATGGATLGVMLPLLLAVLSSAGNSGGINAPVVSSVSGSAPSVIIYSQPVFHVGSNADASEIEEALKRRDEELLNEVDERIKQKQEDERRRKYD
ncbi:MAG: phage tail tape measure protein [Anaerotignum propionicum]|uniref:phage tail tape measure protein n=1 Tax=Anaerotignum propionicum TaxID=28446 RepID=UPI002B1EA9C4|nr:phage tail tape measure protein [Anaerotignum propionicum]MEA5057775.1 phage tail tape measure protein [Anaerotignum propionicum]